MDWKGRFGRGLRLEQLETRALLAGDLLTSWRLLALDVTGDGVIAPADALHLINGLNSVGPQSWQGEGEASGAAKALRHYDVNGDDSFTPLDALTVINRLNESGSEQIELTDIVGDVADDLTPEQQANIETLVQSLMSLRERSGISCEQISELASDLTTLVSEAADPTQEQIDALQSAFDAAMEDGDLSASDIDELKGQVQQLLVELDIDPAKVDAFLTKWQTVIENSDLTAADLDEVLVQIEAVVNSFAPGALDLPDADVLLAALDGWIDDVPGWLDSPLLSSDSPVGFQQVASNALGTFSGQDVVNVLNSPALTVDLPVLGSVNPGTGVSLLAGLFR